ncbi:MAG: sugar phosphate isomerase/epimerase [Planctomycetaceae bacterium]|nr:sugar phosphate isomerase/epimerase [Planctomycetaceae bacterium]
MIRPSVTVSLLSNSPKSPFLLGPDLGAAVATAAELGYPAFELFPPNLEAIDVTRIQQLLKDHAIQLSTIGTGGGWLTQQLTLIDPDATIRQRAQDYIANVIRQAAELGASAIIGSMQGRCGNRERSECLSLLGDQLGKLADVAARCGRPLFYEPLNRYETDLFNTLEATVKFLDVGLPENLQILADLFHMNIEETCTASALKMAGNRIGHVHFVDSNRQVPGRGQTDFQPIAEALREIRFQGFLAIEAFPVPTPREAAATALASFHRWF